MKMIILLPADELKVVLRGTDESKMLRPAVSFED